MLQWLIIGGGIHGTHLSLVLTQVAGVDASRIKVIDPHAEAMATWSRCTHNVGMRFLRSSLVHHIGLDPMELWRYGGSRKRNQHSLNFQGKYKRPSHSLFQRHSRTVIEENGLQTMRMQARAQSLKKLRTGWRVLTSAGEIEAQRVVLCLGMSEQPRWPQWATHFRWAQSGVHHLFDPGFRIDELPDEGRVAVIGAGMSGVQAALNLARERPGRVDLIARETPRCSDFDSDPCYIGDKCMAGFRRVKEAQSRRAEIIRARRPGSVTSVVHQALALSIREGKVNLHIGEPRSLSCQPNGKLRLSTSAAAFDCDQIVLATGFEPERPGGAMIDHLISNHGLSTAPCGYPVVEPSLAWGKELYVTGPLAELELGPVSRNIVGARHAAHRLSCQV